MRKFLITTLSVVFLFCCFLALVGEPVDETALITTATKPGAGSVTRLADPPRKPVSTRSDDLFKSDDLDPLTPLPMPAIVGSDSKTLTLSDDHVGPMATERKFETTTDSDETIAALLRLADSNMAQLYAVLWQALEIEPLADADFREFVLATIEKLGDQAPGEVLATLVLTAPTPALRQSALRLLAEASQELSVGPFKQALEDQDPAIRRSALAFFDELRVNALLAAVADAALDPDREVRLIAFSTLEEMNQFAPVWDVADLLVNDPDPQIRMRALELLTYGGDQVAIDRLVMALNDPNPQVSELAVALLTEFEQDPT